MKKLPIELNECCQENDSIDIIIEKIIKYTPICFKDWESEKELPGEVSEDDLKNIIIDQIQKIFYQKSIWPEKGDTFALQLPGLGWAEHGDYVVATIEVDASVFRPKFNMAGDIFEAGELWFTAYISNDIISI